MRHQFGTAQFDRIAIVQHAVHMRAGTARRGALFGGNIGIHHHQLRARFFLDQTRCLRHDRHARG